MSRAEPDSPGGYGRAPSWAGGNGAPMAGVASVGSDSEDAYGGELEKGAPMPEEPMPPPSPTPVAAKATTTVTTPGAEAPSGRPAESRSPVLIYTADFVLSVYEAQKTIDEVQSLAERAGGFLSKRSDTSITVRVPAGAFQDTVVAIQALGEVVRRNVSSEDVTAEYRDLEVQLANAIAMRDRFAALLTKATNVAESLEIERELGRVTATIERIRGRLKVLSDLAAYSTVTVDVQRKQSAVMQDGPFNLPLPWLQNLGLPRLMRL